MRRIAANLRAGQRQLTQGRCGHTSARDAAAASELKFFFPKADLPALPPAQRKEFIESSLTPTLTKGLIALCRAKPDAPVEWLARWLLDNNPKMPKP